MFKVYKNTSFIILILIIFFTNKAYSEVSYLNLNELMTKSIVGKYINTYIDNEEEKISNKFKKQENELRNKEAKLLGQKNILKKEEYQSQVINLQDEVKLYNKNKKIILNKFNKKKIESSKKVFEKLNPILTNYMKTNSVSLILRKKDIIVGKKSLDITSKIIELLNKEIQKIDF